MSSYAIYFISTFTFIFESSEFKPGNLFLKEAMTSLGVFYDFFLPFKYVFQIISTSKISVASVSFMFLTSQVRAIPCQESVLAVYCSIPVL